MQRYELKKAMMEYSSDDEDSSGDEMLNMKAPFSQDSVTQKVTGKKSESDGDSDDEDEEGSPIKIKKRKNDDEDVDLDDGKQSDDNNDATTNEVDNDAIALADATTAFKIQFNNQRMGTTNKLYWNERRQKKNVTLYPIRVVPRDEVIGLFLKEWNADTERPVQYIQYPHRQIKRDLGLYNVVSLKSLTPYHGDGPTDSWCAKRFQQYSKQLRQRLKGLTEIDLMTEKTFLGLVLEQSLKEYENEKELSSLFDKHAEENAEKEDEQAENDDEDVDDDGSGGGRAKRLCRDDTAISEPLRPGDVIEYLSPVVGERHRATVMYINPKCSPILRTDHIYTLLPDDHHVKRVKRKSRGKLHDNPGGRFRAINSYCLKKEGNPNAVKEIIAEQTAQLQARRQRAKDDLESKMDDGGFFPRDLIR
uniref:Uncharacterized protein n=1 Tax=Skeletonema marinoi TaxID=267567 RepID=A0A7S2M4A6_9STRA|mmetsp:Transcript_4499/g.7737  ORF Transcript_4499/g.7737 Transcript_4499/m.7737 type:complete len:419 (+) Transcript_4499:116-1372(+)